MPVFAFGPFLLDTTERLLTRDGKRLYVSGKPLQILELLVEARGRLVERRTLCSRLWPAVTVEARTLTVHIARLRKVLDGPAAGFIETVRHAGYRLAAPVQLIETPAPQPDAIPHPTRAASVVSLAVLPLSMPGALTTDNHLGIGIADAIISQLSRLPRLGVRPTSAIVRFADLRDAVEVGRRLQVGRVLEGIIQRDNERLRVSAQLVDASTGAVLWSERFEQPTASAFELQDAIAERIARSVLPQLSATDHAALNSYHPRSVEAYFLQLQARAELSRVERTAAFRALALFQRALALDAGYAMAYAGLASTYQALMSNTLQRAIPVHEGAMLAREAAERALALDDGLAEAHAALGCLKMSFDWDWQGAEEHMQRAVALSPNSVEVVEIYGWFQTAMGRLQEALEMLTRARGLDPLRRQTLEFLGATHWMAGDAERALAMLADAVALDPQALRPRFRRLIILDHLEREDEAMAERTTWLVVAGEAQLAERLSALHRSQGYGAVVREWIDLLERQGQWYDIADQWMTLDEPERALDALKRCLEERHTYVPFMLRHPVFRPLHAKPRFRRLARRLDMPEPAQARSTELAAASAKASRRPTLPHRRSHGSMMPDGTSHERKTP